MSKPQAMRIIVHGHVQGVFFRAFTANHARELGINGYVLNCPDGTVEVYAEGNKEKLEKLIDHIKTGPPAASVKSTEINCTSVTGKYHQFAILPSED